MINEHDIRDMYPEPAIAKKLVDVVDEEAIKWLALFSQEPDDDQETRSQYD